MARTNIIILATFWNELDWIRPSLEQIQNIDPVELIICDGNFDPSFQNQSTDGTREIITEFINNTKIPTQMINAIRIENKLKKGFNIFMNSGCPDGSRWNFGRAKVSLVSQFKTNIYRINQALTFAHMSKLSKKWKKDRWVMTYDADQFYSEELIKTFSQTINTDFHYDIITANELTFPFNFNQFTKDYEERNWNNLPHRIKKNMAVYPTRHFMIENFFSSKNYEKHARTKHSGFYHHYKFRKNKKRIEDGYNLGDRKPPDPERYKNLNSADKILFPEIIKKYFQI